MELYQLRTFITAAKERSFSRAAQDLALSQSAVSRQIEALEDTFGLVLFVRGGRSVHLTDAGDRLLSYAQGIVQKANEAEAALRELRELEAGNLVVGATAVPARHVAAPAIVEFVRQHPRIVPRLVIGSAADLGEALVDGSIHVALMSGEVTNHDVFLEPCCGDRLLLVGREGHPLARREGVTPGDIACERLLVPPSGACERAAVDAFLALHGLGDDVCTWEFGDSEAIKQAVTAGGGLAFLSELTVASDLRAGLLAQVLGPDLTIPRPFFLAYSKAGRRAPAVLAFSTLMRKLHSTKDVQSWLSDPCISTRALSQNSG